MKPAFIVVLLSVCSTVAAQPVQKPLLTKRFVYTLKVEKYKKVKTVGIIMAIAGGIMLPIGVSKYEEGRRGGACLCSPPSTSPQPSAADDENYRTGLLLTVAGSAFTATGLTLTTVGFSKQKEYQNQLESLGPYDPEIERLELIEAENNQKEKERLRAEARENKQKRIEALGVKELEKYQRRKVVGVVMTVAGGILFVSRVPNAVNTGSADTPMAIGAALVGTGIPLFFSGANNEKRYHRRVDGVTLNLNITPQLSGLTLAYKF